MHGTLVLLVLTAAVLLSGSYLLQGAPPAPGGRRQAASARLGRWRWLGYGFAAVVGRTSVGLLLGTVFY